MCQVKCQNRFKFTTIFQFFCLFTCILLRVEKTNCGNVPLPLGIVFGQGSPEVQAAFKHALLTFNLNITVNPKDIYRFTAYVDTINTADAFKLSKLICNQFSRGIYAMVGSMNAESFHTYHAFANTFHMPLITPWYPSKDLQNQYQTPSQKKEKNSNGNGMDYATKLRPDFNPAILETINHYGWKEIIFLYSNNEGLLRLQTLFYRSSSSNALLKVKLVKKIATAKDAIAILKEVEKAERFTNKYVLLDTSTELAQEIIINHVRDVQLGRRTYHYLLAGLAFDDTWAPNILEYNAVNITSFRMVDPSRRFVTDFLQKWAGLDTTQFLGAGKNSISTTAAFMYDAMLIIKEAFTDILGDNPYAFQRYGAESACESGSDFLDDIRPFEYGQNVNQHLRRVQTEGLTGNIQFHENGTRKYFTIDVMELRDNMTTVKIGQWTDYSGFSLEPKVKNSQSGQNFETQHEKDVYIVTTVLEEPFLKLKSASQRKSLNLSGNEIYEGYIKDLADKLFDKLGLKYKIQLARDGKYGSKINTPYGENWNGVVGEIIRNEADLAIAPLAINSERERVVEFSKPFLTQGISILAFKPKKPVSSMFGFLRPLGMWVWVGLALAYVGVTAALYIIYRLTNAQAHSNHHHTHNKGPQPTRVNGNGELHLNHLQVQGQGHNQMYLIQKGSKGAGTSGPSASNSGRSLTLANFFWMTFSILANNRTNPYFSRSIAGRVASTAWWLFALLLVSLYTGNYIAIRMRNKGQSPIRSAWDLVDRNEVQYGTLVNGATFNFFKNSENQVYRAMFEHMNGPNQQNFPSIEDGINFVRQKKGKYVFLTESAKIEYVSNRKPCNTMKVGYDLAEMQYGIGLPIGSLLTNKLNVEILKLRESGVLQQLEEKWWKNNIQCEVATKLDQLHSSNTNEDELTLGNLAGIFYVLIIGLVVAVFVSFLEAFCSSPSSPKTNKTKDPSQSLSNENASIKNADGVVHQLQQRNASFSSTTSSQPHHHHHQNQNHSGGGILRRPNANAIIDSVPMPGDFCDISPDMNTK